MHRPAPLALLAILLAAAPLLAGCDANPSDRANQSERPCPSPLPYGYREPASRGAKAPPKAEGEELDEIVAVVWGEVLTRRRLIRLTGERAPGEDETSFRRTLALRRLRWARQQLFVKAAVQEGLHVPSAALDEAVEERKEQAVKILSKNTGRPVTFQEYLDQQNLSEEEFREQVKNDELQNAYLRKLRMGLGRGTRPQIDLTVSPAEVRRLYREQPALFDVPQTVTFAVFMLRVVDAAVGDVTPVQAETLTKQKAEAIAAAFRTGEEPASIAKRLGLDERQWKEFTEPVHEYGIKDASEWLFDTARKPREAVVLQPPGFDGPLVVGTLSVTPGKKQTYDEAYEAVVNAYRAGRSLRLQELKVIELVQGGAVAWPPALADELVEHAREQLRRIDEDKAYSHARFR
jgi:hypothetical protein